MKILRQNKMPRSFYKSLLIVAALGSGIIFTTATAAEMPMKSESAMMAPMESSSMLGGAAPEDARDPNAHSGGFEYRGMAGWEETDEIVFSKVIADQIEYRNNDGNDTVRLDVQGWRGTDYKKFWVKFEGDNETSSNVGDLELQTLYSRSIAAFWDFQLGARYDRVEEPNSSSDRFFAVIGFQGLAPYWFELEPALFVSDDGDVSARVVSTYDLLFSQRLILQPRFEINVAGSEVREWGVGKGVNDIQVGLRLRYEIRREVAPYIGLSWTRQLGDTEDLVLAGGGDANNLAIVTGIRLWF